MEEVNYETYWDDNESHSQHPSVKLRYKFILKNLNKLQFESLIDVGCGDGELVKSISEIFPLKKITGTDVSAKVIEVNKTKNAGIDFFRSDISKKEVINKTFDIVICSEVIEHLNNWEVAIENLYQMTEKNGYLFLTTQSGKRFKSDINIGHLQHFKLDELSKFLEFSGFTIVKGYKKGFPFYNLQKWLYQLFENKAKDFQTGDTGKSIIGNMIFKITYFLFRLSPRSSKFGPQIFILAKKNN